MLNADVPPGSSLAVCGAGLFGLMSAACARMLGAERISMVGHHPYRLEQAAEAHDVTPIDSMTRTTRRR